LTWAILLTIVAIIAVSILIWIKQKLQGGLSSDDYFMVVGYLATMGVSIASWLTITVYHWSKSLPSVRRFLVIFEMLSHNEIPMSRTEKFIP
jgi:hypothetical protein